MEGKKIISQRELDTAIQKHRMFLENSQTGEKANFDNFNLSGMTFTGANLEGARFFGSTLISADFRSANLKNCNFRHCDLRNADFREADLRGALLDFSSFPLWCGGTRFKTDARLVAQVLAHLCSLDVPPEVRAELDKILPFAQTSHRAIDCGISEP